MEARGACSMRFTPSAAISARNSASSDGIVGGLGGLGCLAMKIKSP
jgi:hypothetical protein